MGPMKLRCTALLTWVGAHRAFLSCALLRFDILPKTGRVSTVPRNQSQLQLSVAILQVRKYFDSPDLFSEKIVRQCLHEYSDPVVALLL